MNSEIVKGLLESSLIVKQRGGYKLSNEFEKIKREIVVTERSKPIDTVQLIDVESDMLNLIIQNNNISRRELAEKLEIAQSTVQVYLKNLEDYGYIKRQGKTKGSHWIVLVSGKE